MLATLNLLQDGQSRKQPLKNEFANYGEYLYIEGLASIEQKKQQSAHASMEQEKKEVDGLTFQPEITEKSRTMCPMFPVWQRLGSTAPSSSAARKRAVHQAESEKGLVECTFKPRVCICNPCAGKHSLQKLSIQYSCRSTSRAAR